MNDATFLLALRFTLRWEGSRFVNDPDDRGGATYRGVTQRVYDAFRRGLQRVTRSVRYLSDDELRAIYYRDYWVKAGCNRIGDRRLAIAHFDFAVNSGVSRAVRYLQDDIDTYLPISESLAVDGSFGPKTAAALKRALGRVPPDYFTTGYIDERERFLVAIAKGRQAKFRKGWLRRVADLRRYIATVA
jgi:lysozyme family protein